MCRVGYLGIACFCTTTRLRPLTYTIISPDPNNWCHSKGFKPFKKKKGWGWEYSSCYCPQIQWILTKTLTAWLWLSFTVLFGTAETSRPEQDHSISVEAKPKTKYRSVSSHYSNRNPFARDYFQLFNICLRMLVSMVPVALTQNNCISYIILMNKQAFTSLWTWIVCVFIGICWH